MRQQERHYNRRNGNTPFVLVTRYLAFFLCVCGLGLIGYYMWREFNRQPVAVSQPPIILREKPEESIPEPVIEPLPETFYTIGSYFGDPRRDSYADGDMQLYIPRMELKVPILNGVDDETLIRGVGLFDQSQLPGDLEQNANVCIAGHRDIYGMEFLHIDKITNGDKIYLTFEGDLYTYEYYTTFTTNHRDWDPIRVKDYPALTMQSCTPIGTGTDRSFVIGRLGSSTPDRGFPSQEEQEAQRLAEEDGMDAATEDIPFPGVDVPQ